MSLWPLSADDANSVAAVCNKANRDWVDFQVPRYRSLLFSVCLRIDSEWTLYFALELDRSAASSVPHVTPRWSSLVEDTNSYGENKARS